MTALALVSRADAVHLIADAGHFVRGGELVDIRTKIEPLPLMRAVFAVRGSEDHNQILKHHFAKMRSFDDLIAQAGEIVRAMMSRYPQDKAFRRAFPYLRTVDVFVAGVSARVGPLGFVVTSDPASEPFVPQAAPFALAPSVREGKALWRSAQAGPIHDTARAILQAQRESGAGGVFRGPCYVGGFGEVATVTLGGVVIEQLGTWADTVGQRCIARTPLRSAPGTCG